MHRDTLYYMSDTLTVRLDAETLKALDTIAEMQDRDRTYIVKEALRAYLEVNDWQLAHIRQGLREARAGKFAADADVRATIARLTRK
jgi:predicted transcriptional regulator